MAEAHARMQHFEDRANSNLVMFSSRIDTSTYTHDEPSTGEPQSLWGKAYPKRLIDRDCRSHQESTKLRAHRTTESLVLSPVRGNALYSSSANYNATHDATSTGGDAAVDGDIGVAVEFEEEQEGEDSEYLDEEQEESEDDSKGEHHVETGHAVCHAVPTAKPEAPEKVLKVLAEGSNDREVESHLVMLLDYNKFDLIKVLVKESWKVVWCTRLARVADNAKRKRIKEQMINEGGHTLCSILQQLHATRATTKERHKNLERSIREDARKLRDNGREGVRGANVDGWWAKGQHQVLDLDQLSAFHDQTGLPMATNINCKLPNKMHRTLRKGYEECMFLF
ncbi:hypothetical protein L7F22_039573 [Adiantum nelumboides]|nr:hypothetical protein [Adiantum nelumboides]